MLSSTNYHKFYYLPDIDLQALQTNFPICGSPAFEKIFVSVQQKPQINLIESLNCFGASVSRRPIKSSLYKYYADYYDNTEIIRRDEQIIVNRKKVRRLMQLMGVYTIYPKLNLIKRFHAQYVRPYLLRNLAITEPNQVWGIDTSVQQQAA